MRYIAIAFLSALLFGASTPIGKSLLESIPPFQLAGLFYLGAALGVLPFLLSKQSGFRLYIIDRKNLFRLSGAVFLGGTVGPVLLLFGLQMASSASVAMWMNLELAATAALGFLMFKDHLGVFGWVGVSGTILASLLLSWHEGNIGAYALILVAGASICWGLDNHLTALIDGITPAQSTFWKGVIAGSVNLLISFFAESSGTGLATIIIALVVGMFSYGFSITLYILSAQNLGATRSQMIFASAPFFGVMLSLVILGEKLSVLQIVSAILLMGSIGVLFRDRHGHHHQHNSMAHDHAHRHDDQHHYHVHQTNDEDNCHSHWHKHSEESHAHPHWPDIHHRHDHK